jgi:hypothetical protein
VIRAWLGKANGRTGCVKHGIGRRWHAWKRCVCVDSFCSCPRGPSGLMGIERVGAIAGYIGRARWRGESSRFARRRWSATVIRGLYPYRRLYYAVCMCIVYVSSMTMSIWAVSDRGRASRLPRRVFFPSCCLCILRPWLTCLVASGTFFSHGLPVPSQAWCLPWSPPRLGSNVRHRSSRCHSLVGALTSSPCRLAFPFLPNPSWADITRIYLTTFVRHWQPAISESRSLHFLVPTRFLVACYGPLLSRLSVIFIT